jgi:hypothetical protein
MPTPDLNTIIRHFRGGLYRVLCYDFLTKRETFVNSSYPAALFNAFHADDAHPVIVYADAGQVFVADPAYTPEEDPFRASGQPSSST